MATSRKTEGPKLISDLKDELIDVITYRKKSIKRFKKYYADHTNNLISSLESKTYEVTNIPKININLENRPDFVDKYNSLGNFEIEIDRMKNIQNLIEFIKSSSTKNA